MTRSPAVQAAIDYLKDHATDNGVYVPIGNAFEALEMVIQPLEAQPSPEAEKLAADIMAAIKDSILGESRVKPEDAIFDEVVGLIGRYAAAVRAQALEEAAEACNLIAGLRNMPGDDNTERAGAQSCADAIRALPPTQGGE